MQNPDQWLKVAATTLAVGLVAIVGDSLRERLVNVGDTAPQFAITSDRGTKLSRTDFGGKLLVLNFWATWCPPCVAEIPGYIALQKKYAAQGLVIIGISMDRRGPAAVEQFAAARGINYTIVMGDDASAEAFGGIEALPTTFLINRQGVIVHRKIGAVATEEYEKLVQQALR